MTAAVLTSDFSRLSLRRESVKEDSKRTTLCPSCNSPQKCYCQLPNQRLPASIIQDILAYLTLTNLWKIRNAAKLIKGICEYLVYRSIIGDNTIRPIRLIAMISTTKDCEYAPKDREATFIELQGVGVDKNRKLIAFSELPGPRRQIKAQCVRVSTRTVFAYRGLVYNSLIKIAEKDNISTFKEYIMKFKGRHDFFRRLLSLMPVRVLMLPTLRHVNLVNLTIPIV